MMPTFLRRRKATNSHTRWGALREEKGRDTKKTRKAIRNKDQDKQIKWMEREQRLEMLNYCQLKYYFGLIVALLQQVIYKTFEAITILIRKPAINYLCHGCRQSEEPYKCHEFPLLFKKIKFSLIIRKLVRETRVPICLIEPLRNQV